MMAVSAWETSDDHRQMYGGGTHSEAVRQFFDPELAAQGMTRVWTSGRFNAWVRCQSAMEIVSIERLKANVSGVNRCRNLYRAGRPNADRGE